MSSRIILYSVVCILALHIYLNFATTTKDIPTPDTNNSIKVQLLEKYDREIDAWIHVNDRLAALEPYIQDLQKQIDQIVLRNDDIEKEVDNCREGLANNTKMVEDLLNKTGTHLKVTSQTYQRYPCLDTSPYKKEFPKNLVEAIKNHQFAYVEQEFWNISCTEQITRDIYRATSFDTIIEFANEMTTIDRTYDLLRSMYVLMIQEKPHIKNIYQMMSLVETLKREVINQRNVSNVLKPLARDLLNLIVNTIMQTASDILTNAMEKGVYSADAERIELSEKLFSFNPDIYHEVMIQVVNKTHRILPLQSILDNIMSDNYIIQQLIGLVSIFWKIKELGKIEDALILDVAGNLSSLQKKEEYSNLSADQVKLVDDVIAQLPICAKNLFFEESFCLWNEANAGYMYAPGLSYNFDTTRRRVFIWTPGMPVTGSYWKVEKDGRNIFFKNRDQNDEYLYADSTNFDAESRNVFTWIPSGSREEKFAWNVDIHGDFCHFKSVQFEEELYASWQDAQLDMKYIFTWKSNNSIFYRKLFQWQIRSCS